MHIRHNLFRKLTHSDLNRPGRCLPASASAAAVWAWQDERPVHFDLGVPVGKKFVLEADTADGKERIEILIPGWTKTVLGLETLVYWDRVYLDGELIEDTRDYLAQHKNGDVWYFGENVDNYEDGKLVDHEGAWLAGEDGALPGIWLKADAAVGDKFRQEFYAGKAEDAAEVIGVGETVETPMGRFEDCIKTFEWSPLFSETAHKFYCRETGAMTLEIDLVGPDVETETRTRLVEVDDSGAFGIPLLPDYADEGMVTPK